MLRQATSLSSGFESLNHRKANYLDLIIASNYAKRIRKSGFLVSRGKLEGSMPVCTNTALKCSPSVLFKAFDRLRVQVLIPTEQKFCIPKIFYF